MKKLKLYLILYILFDVLIGGYCGGFFPGTLSEAASAQTNQYTSPGSIISRIGGRIFYAEQYNLRNAGIFIVGGNSATGSQSITLSAGSVKLQDGRAVVPFAVGVPLTINDASQETVTITAVSNCTPSGTVPDIENPAAYLCTITATFANTHGAGALVTSGDNGILEAFNDAGNSGGGFVFWSQDCGTVTLSTGGASTTTTCTIPKTFGDAGASVYVKTTVTTAASYSIGLTGSTAAFVTSCTSLTAGTNCSQFQTGPAQVTQGTGTGTVLITANATPGAGALHVTVWGKSAVQSNF